MFCKKCGSLLRPKIVSAKSVMACSCGYINSGDLKLKDQKKKEEIKHGIVDEEKTQMLPLTDAECPKCGNRKAYYWLVQTRAADEGETKFLRCQKCRHTWREYH